MAKNRFERAELDGSGISQFFTGSVALDGLGNGLFQSRDRVWSGGVEEWKELSIEWSATVGGFLQ